VIRTATKKANRTEPTDAARKPGSRKPDSETAFRRVQVARAFEDIARQIREELLQGRLRPGDRLPAERELAVQFGVSRNTLREALRSLEIAGLITLRKGAAGGAFINDTNGDTVVTSIKDMFSLGAVTTEQITEARISVESAIIRAACEVHTAADIRKLRENLELAAEATKRNDFFGGQTLISNFTDPCKSDPQPDPDRRHGSLDASCGNCPFDRFAADPRLCFPRVNASCSIEARNADAAVGDGTASQARQSQLSCVARRAIEAERDYCRATLARSPCAQSPMPRWPWIQTNQAPAVDKGKPAPECAQPEA
jgi:DNA-binding transcriptional regulator YhcF (GntR family)